MVGSVVLLVATKQHRQHLRAARQINALVFAGRRDEARAALATMSKSGPGILEAQRLALESSIASMFGEHDKAIECAESALGMASAGRYRLFRDAIRMSLASTFAERGNVEAARKHRQAIEMEHRNPLMRMYLVSTDIAIAFAAKKPHELPDDETMHEIARVALGFHHSASVLVLLAWAFTQRGDREMANHLLEQVEERSDFSYLASAYPSLAQWRVGHSS